MAADLIIDLAGTPTPVYLGENTAEALRQANRASTEADRAEAAAALAASYATDGGALLPSVWTRLPALYAIRLRGAGTVTIDTKTADDVISTAVVSFTPTGPVQVEYSFLGADAAYARATLTGTASAEVF